MKQIVGVLCAVMLVAATAQASTITFNYDVQFSNGTLPGGPAPWMSAVFDDSTAAAGQDLRLTLSTFGLTDAEFISEVFFSFKAPIDPLNVTLSLVTNTPSNAYQSYSVGQDAFQADGDGIYDLRLNFGTSAGTRFGANQTVVLDLNLNPGTLLPGSLNVLAAPGGANGPFFTAAHLQGIGPTGALSTWIADGNGGTGNCDGCTPVQLAETPEPASLILIGTGLAGIAAKLRRRRGNQVAF